MSASNSRIRDYDTYHHLISRIAHKVFFMTDEVRNDFIEMIRRAADFCGIKLVAWCIMANHFHILAYLPAPEDIGESEILRRFGVLKGAHRLKLLTDELSVKRLADDEGEAAVQQVLSEIKSSMYDIGSFVKIIKQWLTQEYNRRYSHVGTLWEGVYKDVPVKASASELGKRAGYIHLNPIRAAITPEFSDYPWSSYAALCRGDALALAGMRHIYGEEATRAEIIEAHGNLMSELLEQIKMERAADIARKRAAGFDLPADPLTSEAMIAQAAAHLEMVMKESMQERAIQSCKKPEGKKTRGRPKGGNAEIEKRIRNLLLVNPSISPLAIAEAIGMSRSSVYVYLKNIQTLP